MQPELRVGLVGAGWAALQHSGSIRTIGGARVVAVFDVAFDVAAALSAELDAIPCTSYASLMAAGVDALVVTSPSGVHRQAVVPALEAGVPVFVEKPLSVTLEDAKSIVETAARSGTVCAVGYQWRALDNMQAVREGGSTALLVSQGVGITQARSWFSDARLSGGLIYERVSHHIDLQRMIAGDVTSVSAVRGGVPLSGRSDARTSRDDVLALALRFDSGAVGVITVGWAPPDYPPTQSLELYTTTASYDLRLDPDFVLYDRSGTTEPIAVSEHPFLRQMRSFLTAVRDARADLVDCTAAAAAGTVAVAAAAAASLEDSGEFRLI